MSPFELFLGAILLFLVFSVLYLLAKVASMHEKANDLRRRIKRLEGDEE